jgi:hypothetical protein
MGLYLTDKNRNLIHWTTFSVETIEIRSAVAENKDADG